MRRLFGEFIEKQCIDSYAKLVMKYLTLQLPKLGFRFSLGVGLTIVAISNLAIG